MADYYYSFEAGTPGATITTSDTGSGTPFNSVPKGNAAGVSVYDSSIAAHGTKSARIVADNASTPNPNNFIWNGLNSINGAAARFYVYLSSTPPPGMYLAQLRNSAGRAGQLQLNTTGRLQVDTASTFNIAQSTNPFPIGEWIRVEIIVIPGTTTSNGTIRAAYYSMDSTTPIQTIYSSTTTNAGTTAITESRIGIVAGSTAGYMMRLDDLFVRTETTNFVGPEINNQAPTVDAGIDQSIDPNLQDSFVLTASASDPDGTIASYLWEDVTTGAVSVGTTAGVSIPVTRSTLGSTKTYRVTVTDNQGATATDSVTVTLLPHTRWVMTGSGLVAVRRRVS